MKKGIALIELIFAIVIIGITLISVPNLMKTTAKASNQAITQESISNLASHIDMVMAQFWDENSTNPKYNNPILKVELGNGSLSEANDIKGYFYGRRAGSAISSPRRYAVDINGNKLTATKASALGFENNETEADDIDDFNGVTKTLVYSKETTTAQQGDYKDQTVQITTTINYISDKPTNGATYNLSSISFDNPFSASNIKTQSTNIKTITVILTSSNDGNKTVILKGFSCNIGSSKLKERIF